jgi:predicted MPP superfamily phosphohydrolase
MLLARLRPGQIVIGAGLLGAAGAVASSGVLATLGRRRRAGRLAEGIWWLVLAFLLFCLADWALLWALPHLRLSFAPNITLPLGVAVLVRLLVIWGLFGATLLGHLRRRGWPTVVPARSRARPSPTTALFLLANVALTAIQVDAYVAEPLLVKTTELSLVSADLDPAAPPVRIVHLSDVHIERMGFREATIIKKVNALRPDIIVLTGDHVNLSYLSDPTSEADFRRFVGQLEADHGIHAVRGSVEPTLASMERLVEGTEVVWLEQEALTVNVRGQPVTLAGVACSHRQERDAARLAQAMGPVPFRAFSLLLYHSPDLIHQAAEQGVDLYLGGHTHGGQIRLPLLGPVVTGSAYGRRYASGVFQEGDTTMIISQGLGFEGGGLPRARFLCRPEIVSIELSGA